MTLDEQIDEILESLAYDYTDGATYYASEKEIQSDISEATKTIKALIADEVREAVKEEKSIRAKLITKAHKDGIADGLQMALYGVKNGSKEEKFIRHLLFSENIAELQSTQPSNKSKEMI